MEKSATIFVRPATPYRATEGMVTFPKPEEIYDAFQQMVVLFIRFFSRLIYSSHGKAGSVAAPSLILGCVPFTTYIPCFSFVGGITSVRALEMKSV